MQSSENQTNSYHFSFAWWYLVEAASSMVSLFYTEQVDGLKKLTSFSSQLPVVKLSGLEDSTVVEHVWVVGQLSGECD